jgi:hypothetical protein
MDYNQLFNEVLEAKKNESLFNMDDVNAVIVMDVDSAKAYVKNKLDTTKIKVTPSGKSKILNIIRKARTPEMLAQKLSDFILAHPGEGLKTIKPGQR